MIKLNFIPEYERRDKSGLLSAGWAIPLEVIIGILVAAVGLIVLIHISLGCLAGFKVAQQQILQVKWNAMAADKKAVDDIFNESKALQTKFSTLQPITSQVNFQWAHLLNDISDSVPKGIWLREISFNRGILNISGSSVSKIKNEMISAGNFVSALKEKPTMRESFTGIDIDSIQRREDTALSIADFSLKAKQK
jgi:Tfp pilus assembly protein PilN